MSILLVHLSDFHFKTTTDPAMIRLPLIARAIASEMDGAVHDIVFAFGGDATDKGNATGFDVAEAFLRDLQTEVYQLTGFSPHLVMVPGNHDQSLPVESSLRDAAIKGLAPQVARVRPPASIEREILSPLERYFNMADAIAPGASPTKESPYYVAVTKVLDGRTIRFHLLNSAWMCAKGQTIQSLWFPISQVAPPLPPQQLEYEITLLHHPFGWFKQPEVMRPLRDVIEGTSDLILTGHEHVGRSLKTTVHGGEECEYLEGDALQDGDPVEASGFHILRLDFDTRVQTISTYQWSNGFTAGSYARSVGPIQKPLGRNQRRASQVHRLRGQFHEKLDDPELPVIHKKRGKLRLSDFYTFPDIGRLDDTAEQKSRRVKGEQLVDQLIVDCRSLLVGPARCGKTSLCKRLIRELHARGNTPLLLEGSRLRNATPDRLNRLLDELVGQQYDALTPEAFWQVPAEKQVLVLDDLHNGPSDRKRREKLIAELERRFKRMIVVGAEEFCLEEIFSDDRREAGDVSPLWRYERYRILPFGYMRCGVFIRQWVGLDDAQLPDEAESRVVEINNVVSQFLRSNPIPQYPWVVMVLVQQADSPERPQAEDGSYSYLLQALITAALARSRVKLPVNGKYRWLGELASELYRGDRTRITNADARAVHDFYCKEYGVRNLDYKEMRDDLDAAGVLRVEGDEISFREAYTYCYFVAWHLAQRIHAGDTAAVDEVRRLCEDLYHEDTANVLVFLAHLTTSRLVLQEMTARSGHLFETWKETDFASDVEQINRLYNKDQPLILPAGDPHKNRLVFADQQDEHLAARDCRIQPKREVSLRPQRDDPQRQDVAYRSVMELSAATRTIEILGQVLRNEATGRKLPEMVEITEQIFKLGRRMLGFLFNAAGDRLPTLLQRYQEHFRHRMPDAKDDDVASEASRHLFNLYLFGAFAIVKHVAIAVGEPNLSEVFRQIMQNDSSLPNRIYKLAIDLETMAGRIPLRDAEDLSQELSGKFKSRSAGGKKGHNNLANTLVRALVVDYLFLNYVPRQQVQALCEKMNIDLPAGTYDPAKKRFPKSLPSPA